MPKGEAIVSAIAALIQLEQELAQHFPMYGFECVESPVADIFIVRRPNHTTLAELHHTYRTQDWTLRSWTPRKWRSVKVRQSKFESFSEAKARLLKLL